MSADRTEDALRATFAARAETVTHGPSWDGADEPLPDPAPRRSRARWLAPLAAAAAVLAVVAGVFVVRSEHNATPPVSTSDQLPIPRDMKAIDALGVEVFVPSGYTIVGVCGGNVNLPIVLPAAALTSRCEAPSPRPPAAQVTIAPARPAHAETASACTDPVRLGDERACILASAGVANDFELMWPEHDVAISVVATDIAAATAILRSAHAVPIDRNGCAATNSDLYRELPRNIPDPADVHLNGFPLPTTGINGMSVCWYINNRLAASAALDRSSAQRIAKTVNALPPKWPAPLAQPSLPSCEVADQHDGVQLITHTAVGVDVDAIAQLAACNGQRTVATGRHGVLVEPELAGALAQATGIPFSDGYRANG